MRVSLYTYIHISRDGIKNPLQIVVLGNDEDVNCPCDNIN